MPDCFAPAWGCSVRGRLDEIALPLEHAAAGDNLAVLPGILQETLDLLELRLVLDRAHLRSLLQAVAAASPLMACRPTYGRGLVPRRVGWLGPAPAALRRRACLLMRNGKGDEVPFSWRDLRRFVGSYARPELPRRDADQALEVMGELALVGEAGVQGDLCQGQGAALQELFGALDAAQDDVLVGRQPGGCLELPCEVVGAEAGHCRHLLQGRAGVQVLLDVLDDGAEPPARPPARPPALGPAGGPGAGGAG